MSTIAKRPLDQEPVLITRTKRPWGELERIRREKDAAFYDAAFTDEPLATELLSMILLGETSSAPLLDKSTLSDCLFDVMQGGAKRSEDELRSAILSATADQLQAAAVVLEQKYKDLAMLEAIWQNPSIKNMEQARLFKRSHAYSMKLANARIAK